VSPASGSAGAIDERFWQTVGEQQRRLLDESESHLAALAECLKKLSTKDRQLLEFATKAANRSPRSPPRRDVART